MQTLNIQLGNLLGVFPQLVFPVERIPHLGEEGIDLGAPAIVPAFAFTLVTPVPAFQNQTRAGLEAMAKGTLKFQLGTPITFLHLRADQLPAPELGGLLHVLMGQLALRSRRS